jgi:hypothetical protein
MSSDRHSAVRKTRGWGKFAGIEKAFLPRYEGSQMQGEKNPKNLLPPPASGSSVRASFEEP